MTARRFAAAGALALSAAGAAFISSHEGGARLDAYLDPVGIPTICTGSTEGVRLGQRATFEQCNALLLRDTTRAGQAIARCTHVAITQAQYDALVSFEFNAGAYCSSELARKLNAGDCWGAAAEFNAAPQIDRRTGRPRVWTGAPIIDRRTGRVLLASGGHIMKWTTGRGVPLPGLIKRRSEERTAFESGCERGAG